MDTKDSLGDRMKAYERDYERRLMPFVPAIIRLDGRGFHKVCKGKGYAKPYSEALYRIMDMITLDLMEESNAIIGYSQSDEITLVLYNDNTRGQLFFDGKINKINSVLSSIAARSFSISEAVDVEFDCRTFSVPSKWEAVNCLLWRQQDASRNSVQMAARTYFSHKMCEGKNCNELQEMLWETHKINWSSYPYRFKRGGFFRNHARFDLPPITQIFNPVEVIFENADIIMKDDTENG